MYTYLYIYIFLSTSLSAFESTTCQHCNAQQLRQATHNRPCHPMECKHNSKKQLNLLGYSRQTTCFNLQRLFLSESMVVVKGLPISSRECGDSSVCK